jgi:hypothetical protein
MNSDRALAAFPQGWVRFGWIHMQPARFLAAVLDGRDPPSDSVVREELFRALKADEILHYVDVGRALVAPTPGFARSRIVSAALWDEVDPCGNLDLGGPRTVWIYEESLYSHFRAWLQKLQAAPPLARKHKKGTDPRVLPEWISAVEELAEDLRKAKGLGSEPTLKAAFRQRFKCRHKDADLLWPQFPGDVRTQGGHPTQADCDALERGKPVIEAWAKK